LRGKIQLSCNKNTSVRVANYRFKAVYCSVNVRQFSITPYWQVVAVYVLPVNLPAPMNTKPVIFLAFANDPSNYLEALKQERIIIPQMLQPAIDERLCEVLVEPDATTDDIFRIFNQYKDRIAVFHYAGHSGAEGLQLETDGIVSQLANAGGLAQLFGLQQNLNLVFLNGCSNNQQVNLLQQQGIPNIIATNNFIKDQAAVNFAKAFYQTLGAKNSLNNAYTTAEAYVKTISGQGEHRALFWKNKDTATADFPWEKYFNQPDWSLISGATIYGDKPQIPVFIANHPADEPCLTELKKQLALLKRGGMISIFDSSQIPPGNEKEKELKRQLLNARIILLVISPDFIYADETAEIEAIATQRHKAGTAIVIPILYKEVADLRGENITIPDYYPEFARLRGLPDEHKKWFIGQWPDKDAAYAYIAKRIRERIEQLRNS